MHVVESFKWNKRKTLFKEPLSLNSTYIFFRVSKSVVSQQYNLQYAALSCCLLKNQQTLFVNRSAKINGIKDNTNNVQPWNVVAAS